MWDGQIPALRRDIRVLHYAMPGQGATQGTDVPYSMRLLLHDLVGLWNALGVEKTHLVGLGLGGALAQAAAIEHGERFISVMPTCCRAQRGPEFAALGTEAGRP